VQTKTSNDHAAEETSSHHDMRAFLLFLLLAIPAGFLGAAWRSCDSSMKEWASGDDATAPSVPTQTASSVAPDQSRDAAASPERDHSTYQNAWLSLSYPSAWRPVAAQVLDEQRNAQTVALKQEGRSLLSLGMFTATDDTVGFVVSVVDAGETLNADAFLSERRRICDAFERAGDVTKVNLLERTVVNQLPAVVEDVERSGTGLFDRGRTTYLIGANRLYTLSFVGHKAGYAGHFGEFSRTLASLKIAGVAHAMASNWLSADPSPVAVESPAQAANMAPPETPKDVAAPPVGAKRTTSGLAYRVLTPGKGKVHPTTTSKVTVHYTGWSKDGKMFDSSVQRGEPSSFSLNQVILGWTEGLQLMVEGEKTRFWIPGSLAYGEVSEQPGAPVGQLTFDVELLQIQR
jgi:FKBP-type peptidyl-prolyl cis-trans isomerase